MAQASSQLKCLVAHHTATNLISCTCSCEEEEKEGMHCSICTKPNSYRHMFEVRQILW